MAYALPQRQTLIPLEVEAGTTAREALRLSGIREQHPEIDLDGSDLGIFGRLLDGRNMPLPEEYELLERDRVEVYRPLQLDPKQARLLRARRARERAEREGRDSGNSGN